MSEPAHKSQLEKTEYLQFESSNQRIAKKFDPKQHLGGETAQFRATSEAVAADRIRTTKRTGRYNVHFSNVEWAAVTFGPPTRTVEFELLSLFKKEEGARGTNSQVNLEVNFEKINPRNKKLVSFNQVVYNRAQITYENSWKKLIHPR